VSGANPVVRPMTRFQKLILVFATVLHAPWLGLFVLGGGWLPGAPLAVAALAVSLALFWGRAKAVMDDAPRDPRRVALVDLPYFVHLAALVLAFVPALVTSALAALHVVEWRTLAWVYGACYVAGLYGVYVRRTRFVVRERDVPVSSLPPELDGLRVAHLSDLHVGGLTSREHALRWVRATNEAKPDLVVCTGDYVTSG
jgi:hypothetical protein